MNFTTIEYSVRSLSPILSQRLIFSSGWTFLNFTTNCPNTDPEATGVEFICVHLWEGSCGSKTRHDE